MVGRSPDFGGAYISGRWSWRQIARLSATGALTLCGCLVVNNNSSSITPLANGSTYSLNIFTCNTPNFYAVHLLAVSSVIPTVGLTSPLASFISRPISGRVRPDTISFSDWRSLEIKEDMMANARLSSS